MSVNPKTRRKKRLKKDREPSKSNITRKDKIYGVSMLLTVVILGFLFYWFVLKDILNN